MRLTAFVPSPGEEIPNHPELPVLVYSEVEGAAQGAAACEALFAAHGWGGSWRDGVLDFHHFHSTSHEVLGVVGGGATLAIGGPQGRELDVTAGDVLVLPAGTGHRRLRAEPGFLVVGAYPPGQEDYDLVREGAMPRDEALARIRAVARPPQDPVGGEGVDGW